jgi:hypothetical protein
VPGRAGTCAGPASARGGDSRKRKFAKKRAGTNKVVYDDLCAHSCLCCEECDIDREPTYPCSDFREVRLGDERYDQDVDDLQRMPCEQMPDQLCRSCDEDECVDRVTATLQISRSSSRAPPQDQLPSATLEISRTSFHASQPYDGCNSCDVIETKEESDDECVELSSSGNNNDVNIAQNSGVGRKTKQTFDTSKAYQCARQLKDGPGDGAEAKSINTLSSQKPRNDVLSSTSQAERNTSQQKMTVMISV